MSVRIPASDFEPAVGPSSKWAYGLVRCPKCSTQWTLSKQVHTVAPDGTLTPSFVCPGKECGFHDFVIIDGWIEYPRPTQAEAKA